jgi:acetylornithine/succinyldiaminopimelate/putrescine aminotransferase
MAKLLHAMGDVHPHALKAQLARALSGLTFERWTKPRTQGPPQVPHSRLATRHSENERQAQAQAQAPVPEGSRRGKTIFCNSGFEAVEAALKTAKLATDKPGVIAFTGAYHGVGYGALNATHREHFRSHFSGQLGEFGRFAPFPAGPEELPAVGEAIDRLLRRQPIGAVLVEPIQVRGGINIPPPEFLPLLRRLCDEYSALLILDEIYTGFGRTGKWFACEHAGAVPDLICLGKALTGGFPLSACVGKSGVMDAAWPPSTGEAIHTSTFLGHPVGCAMALAQIEEVRAGRLVQRSASLGRFLLSLLSKLAAPSSGLRLCARGLGLLAGLEVRAGDGSPATVAALGLLKTMLHSGFILLPEGEHANVLSFTPPLTISESGLAAAVNGLERAMGACH